MPSFPLMRCLRPNTVLLQVLIAVLGDTFVSVSGFTNLKFHRASKFSLRKKNFAEDALGFPAPAPSPWPAAAPNPVSYWAYEDKRKPISGTLHDKPRRETEMDNRLYAVKHVDQVVEDVEFRQKPPFVGLPEKNNEEMLTDQQKKGIQGVFDTTPTDFSDCVLIHQYAEPLQVIDPLIIDERSSSTSVAWLEKGQDMNMNGSDPLLIRPGAVYSSDTGDTANEEVHVGNTMFANLEGVANPVQVIPQGAVKDWTSKWRVPIAGFLCLAGKQSHSAPVLHATPTPCIPTTMDAGGNALDPAVDNFVVFIGTTRLSFANKRVAESFCEGYAKEIARDLTTLVWDASKLVGAAPETSAQSAGKGHSSQTLLQDGEQAGHTEGNDSDSDGGGDGDGDFAQDFWDLNIGGSPSVDTERKFGQASQQNNNNNDETEDSIPNQQGNGDEGNEALKPFREDVLLRKDPWLSPVNPGSLSNFIAKTGVRNPSWTTGKKKLLVVVMEWKEGDNSLAPFSKQQDNPIPLYRDRIFPRVQKSFTEMSFGKYQIEFTIVPEVIRYTRLRSQIIGQMPFPALYEQARLSLQGHARLGGKYLFRDYDLVFVIHPQVKPVGTKGIAWVASRGAACNGCETVSENFKVMIAVHELGHNLGLAHASSEALDYGNPFDWMGNYPDVVGLHYGLGYESILNWISISNILKITDSTLHDVNDLVTLLPFDDKAAPREGEVHGIKISLKKEAQDIYLSYRKTVAKHNRGVFVVYQDKTSPNSKLLDAACHSATQQDAHMKKGWTFMSSSHTFVVKIVELTPKSAKVHVYRAPTGTEELASIRSRPEFTDGTTKCPVTCEDSDLLISRSCSSLRKAGYCRAAVRIKGKKLSIGTQVCPVTCGMCEKVLATTPTEVGASSCADKQVRISGMGCTQIKSRDMCGVRTSSGKPIGSDYCKKSCGLCPEEIRAEPNKGEPFVDPEPVRKVGLPDGMPPAQAERQAQRQHAVVHRGVKVPKQPISSSSCEDDPYWQDNNGFGCDVYKNTVPDWGQEQVCKVYNGGIASKHCRQTCGACTGLGPSVHLLHGRAVGNSLVRSDLCVDDTCIGVFMEEFGRCFQCSDYPTDCNNPKYGTQFRSQCPATCGLCKPTPPARPKESKQQTTENASCNDERPEFCQKLGQAYCTETEFSVKCNKTCELCVPPGGVHPPSETCANKFEDYTCIRYAKMGWCQRRDTKPMVELQCRQTCGLCGDQAFYMAKNTEANSLDTASDNATEDAEDQDLADRAEKVMPPSWSGVQRESALLWACFFLIFFAASPL